MRSVLSKLKCRETVLPLRFLLLKNKNSLIGALVLDSRTDRWETEIGSHWNSLAQIDQYEEINCVSSVDCLSPLPFYLLDPLFPHLPRQPLSQDTLQNFCNKSPENIMIRDFSHILLLLSSMEKTLNRGKFGIYTRLMKEIDAVSLALSELTESKIIFFVSCSWVSYCLSFLHLSEVYEVVFASA